MSQFTVQLTPLIRPTPGFLVAGDLVNVAQFGDLDVSHPWKGYKTAKVTLRMEDAAVAGREPYAFALRVLYEDRLEPVFWGQANIIDDYENGLCHIDAQDPSIRMMHHYLRRGDDALNSVVDVDKGTLDADRGGIAACVAAAQNIATQDARNDPKLGLIMSTARAAPLRLAPVVVERGQECWQVVADLGGAEGAPDIDMETPAGLSNYAELATYAPGTMGTDRSTATPDTPAAGKVVLSYAYVQDNTVAVSVDPERPTTHNHVLTEDAKYRVTAAATAASFNTGAFVDWTRTGFTSDTAGSVAVLTEVAQARVKAYGIPLKHTRVVLRPDAVSEHNYGRPTITVPAGTRAPTFYVGDKITVRAIRGNRSLLQNMRVNGVHLTWPGWQGPALTVLDLIPDVTATVDNEES